MPALPRLSRALILPGLLGVLTVAPVLTSPAGAATKPCVSDAEYATVKAGLTPRQLRHRFHGQRAYASGPAEPGIRYTVYRSCWAHSSVVVYVNRKHRVVRDPAWFVAKNKMLDV